MKYLNYAVLLGCAVAAAYVAGEGIWIALLAPVLVAAITVHEMHFFKDDSK